MNTFSQRIQKYHNSLLISSPVANGAIDLPYSFCTFEIHSHILYFVFPVNTVWTVLKFSLSFGILSISAHVCVCIHSVWHSIGWMNRHLFSTFYWQMDISVAVTLFPVVNLSEHPCICPLVNMRHLLLNSSSSCSPCLLILSSQAVSPSLRQVSRLWPKSAGASQEICPLGLILHGLTLWSQTFPSFTWRC